MAQLKTSNGKYSFDYVIFPSEHSDQFNEFMDKYGGLSDSEIYGLMMKTKNKLSNDIVQKHIANLDALSNMNGFVTDSTRQRIALAKQALTSKSGSPNKSNSVETQFFGGSSLLLWFLLLTSIYRRPFAGPYYGRRFRRPFY